MKSSIARLSLLGLVVSLTLGGCAAETDDSDPASSDDDLKVGADLDVRGTIAQNSCVTTRSVHGKKYIAFSLVAKAGQTFDAALVDFGGGPDMRVYTEAGKQVARSQKTIDSDGVDASARANLSFSARTAGLYYVAIRDVQTSAASRPSLFLGKSTGACREVN
jgi:hypothetical protein